MSPLVYQARSPEATDQFAAALAGTLPETLVVALLGTLGAGKTYLVQALAAALGIDRREVTSPTFVLCQHYHGGRTLYHLDAYRLASAGQLWDLGVEEYFDGPGITLIEWADRVAEVLPADRVTIEITIVDDHQRHFLVTAGGPRAAGVVDALQRRLANQT